MTHENCSSLQGTRIQDGPFHPRILAPSEALRHKHQHLQALTQLAHQFGGRVVDISTDNCIVELYFRKIFFLTLVRQNRRELMRS
jgi:acetolactate synthase-1/3 small subunit